MGRTGRTAATQTFSIFGQIEEVVARALIEEGECREIPASMIPSSALTNERGERAKFAIVVPGYLVLEFNTRIARLRA